MEVEVEMEMERWRDGEMETASLQTHKPCDIGLNESCGLALAAKLGLQLLASSRPSAAEDHLGAGVGKDLDKLSANARCGASDDGNLAVESRESG